MADQVALNVQVLGEDFNSFPFSDDFSGEQAFRVLIADCVLCFLPFPGLLTELWYHTIFTVGNLVDGLIVYSPIFRWWEVHLLISKMNQIQALPAILFLLVIFGRSRQLFQIVQNQIKVSVDTHGHVAELARRNDLAEQVVHNFLGRLQR